MVFNIVIDNPFLGIGFSLLMMAYGLYALTKDGMSK